MDIITIMLVGVCFINIYLFIKHLKAFREIDKMYDGLIGRIDRLTK